MEGEANFILRFCLLVCILEYVCLILIPCYLPKMCTILHDDFMFVGYALLFSYLMHADRLRCNFGCIRMSDTIFWYLFQGSDSSLDDCVYHFVCPCCTLCQVIQNSLPSSLGLCYC